MGGWKPDLKRGPLGPYTDGYIARLSAMGYLEETTRRSVSMVARMSRWLQKQGLSAEIDELTISKFLKFRSRKRCIRKDLAPLRHLLDYLRELGVAPMPIAPSDENQLDPVTNRFEQYLICERGLSERTVESYVFVVRRFLKWRFGRRKVRLRALNLHDATRFISSRYAESSAVYAKSHATAVRCFLRFLHLRGETSTDLAEGVPTVAFTSRAELPRYVSDDDVLRILKTCDRKTPRGRRNYAILLLLARLGLRPGEIVAMTLDDIDWDVGAVTIHCSKAVEQHRLPMPADVGESLALYLKDRPSCDTRRVFLTMRAPRKALKGSSSICIIVRWAIARAGLQIPHRGAYVLRHSLATRMLRSGASLADVGEILRHQSPDTTAIYAKVDLTSLRGLALPWPAAKEVE